MKLTKQELEVMVAANDFRAALEEVIFLTVRMATDKADGGGMRHEESKRRFSAATVNLFRAFTGKRVKF